MEKEKPNGIMEGGLMPPSFPPAMWLGGRDLSNEQFISTLDPAERLSK